MTSSVSATRWSRQSSRMPIAAMSATPTARSEELFFPKNHELQETESMPRLAPLDLAKLTPEQKKVADAIVAGPRGGLRGPFEPWLRSPVLADRAQKLGEYCRFNSSLPKDLSELAICLIGRHFKAQYEVYAHARLAKEAGVSNEIVE